MKLMESGEMYLETLLVLSKTMPAVRSINLCEAMGFSKPSVSRAVGLLKENNYINVDKDGFLTLTETGRAIAEKIYERHTVISSVLMRLGVSEAQATEDACKIEHDISDESFNAIKTHIFQHQPAEK